MFKSNYTPVRPPRSSKVSKDTTGRLMHIIAELSVSNKSDDRKSKMLELKKDFNASDAKINELVACHHNQLSTILKSFSLISAKINATRVNCQNVKEKLKMCKKLLECKQQEIQRLWFESVQHREVSNMLMKIEDMNKVPDKVDAFLKEQQFLEATELLVNSLTVFDETLSQADALKDLKIELTTLKKKMHNALVGELNKALYCSPPDIFLQKGADNKNLSYEDTFSNIQKKKFLVQLPVCSGEIKRHQKDPKYDHIALILKCITMLNTLPETIEILRENSSKELMQITQTTSEIMATLLKNSSYTNCNSVPFTNTAPMFSNMYGQKHLQSQFFLDLLETIIIEFKQVAINYCVLSHNMIQISEKSINQTDIDEFEVADIYSKIQTATEALVEEYLDLHTNQQSTMLAEVSTNPNTDLSVYFLRKTITRPKKHSLFKFDASAHAISKKIYLQEQKDLIKEKNDIGSPTEVDRSFPLVCPPAIKNISVVYKSLRKFSEEIESALGMTSGTHCPLYAFVSDCGKAFLDQVNYDINRLIEKAAIAFDTWEPISDADKQKFIEDKMMILNSTLMLNSSIREIESLIHALPDFAGHFMQLICHVLQSYKDLCCQVYRGLTCPDADQQTHIFSVSWTKDEDINRLLRSLPNWINLEMSEKEEKSDEYEAPEEIRFRNKEESELLIRNLSANDSISLNEIISDHNKLRNLALTHESMEWLSSEVISLASADSLPDLQTSVASLLDRYNDDNEAANEVVLSMSTKVCLKKLAKDFTDLAESCLLVLHLEVRSHCFYYLLQLSKQNMCVSCKDEEADPLIVRLNSDLSKINEFLNPVLQPKKLKYIFEGLGELLSTILIKNVSSIKKINENGMKKMNRNIFALQQNLAGITMTREVALDRARQYFDLLNHSCEDILNLIVEEGPLFQEHEYCAVLQLLHNSREDASKQEPVSYYLDKLHQILDEVAVPV